MKGRFFKVMFAVVASAMATPLLAENPFPSQTRARNQYLVQRIKVSSAAIRRILQAEISDDSGLSIKDKDYVETNIRMELEESSALSKEHRETLMALTVISSWPRPADTAVIAYPASLENQVNDLLTSGKVGLIRSKFESPIRMKLSALSEIQNRGNALIFSEFGDINYDRRVQRLNNSAIKKLIQALPIESVEIIGYNRNTLLLSAPENIAKTTAQLVQGNQAGLSFYVQGLNFINHLPSENILSCANRILK